MVLGITHFLKTHTLISWHHSMFIYYSALTGEVDPTAMFNLQSSFYRFRLDLTCEVTPYVIEFSQARNQHGSGSNYLH
jgi:hypothetical protein